MRSDDYRVSNEEKVVRFVMALCVLKRLVKQAQLMCNFFAIAGSQEISIYGIRGRLHCFPSHHVWYLCLQQDRRASYTYADHNSNHSD